jgi:hypothetical protein
MAEPWTILQRRGLEFSPKPLSSGDQADEIAHTFGGLYQEVLNRTVTADSVRVLPIRRGADWSSWEWLLSKFDNAGIPLPLRLTGDAGWLLAEHRVGIRESNTDGQLWLTTLRYCYRWQADEDDGTWLVRWDYRRDGGPPHLHLHGDPASWSSGSFHKLHFPTRRVPIEDVIRFLITDERVSVEPRSEHWEDVLDAASTIFEQIQRREFPED